MVLFGWAMTLRIAGVIPSSESNDSLDTHPVIPDAPQRHFGGAVLIRDRKCVNT